MSNEPNRFLVQFRNWEKTYFVTDCAFRDFKGAKRYVKMVFRHRVMLGIIDGRILDALKKKCVCYICDVDH
jgi:hypothetical protein